MAETVPITLSEAMGEKTVALMNACLEETAKPLLEKALSDIERAMRERLGGLMISMIEKNFSCYLDRGEIHIVLHQAQRGDA